MLKYMLPIAAITMLLFGAALAYRSYVDKKATNAVKTSQATFTYVALGDSYTIGQSVAEHERWPNMLTDRLQENNLSIELIANPSVTGYTTQDLIDRELPLVQELQPTFVTLLIGVNDYVQGVNEQTFQRNLRLILDTLQGQPGLENRILLVTIPDFGKTSAGQKYGDPAESEAAIKNFNRIIKDEADKRELPVADIFEVSQMVATDTSLTARDGLHPSGKQYELWTSIIYRTAIDAKLLK